MSGRGALGGRAVGAHKELRMRRLLEKIARGTGDDLGDGLELDAQARLAIKKIPRIDAQDPNALAQLFAFMQEQGIMER